MTGYENSPDYGGPKPGRGPILAVFAIMAALAVAIGVVAFFLQ